MDHGLSEFGFLFYEMDLFLDLIWILYGRSTFEIQRLSYIWTQIQIRTRSMTVTDSNGPFNGSTQIMIPVHVCLGFSHALIHILRSRCVSIRIWIAFYENKNPGAHWQLWPKSSVSGHGFKICHVKLKQV